MEEGEGERKEKSQGDLVDIVFSWSIEDVLNKDLLKEKVKKIPYTFQSVQHYFGSYVTPLIEETHADLCSSMEALSQAPLLRIEESKGRKEEFEYDMKVRPLRIGGRENYIPKKDDVFALSEVRPASVADLNRDGRSYVIAVVTKAKDDQRGPSYKIRIKASKAIALPNEWRRSLLAVFLMNINTNNRIWKALCWDPKMQRNLNVIEGVLVANPTVAESCDLCSSGQNINVEDESLRNRLLSFNLNSSQLAAVLSSISARQCKHRHSVKLIWGPPGTGKTKTVSTLLWALMAMKCRTLTCAPTNVAVLEVTSRLLRLVRDSCRIDDWSLGGIVLFGNKDRMNIDDDLQDVFLDYRVKRLAECFAPLSGWNHQLNSMIGLLENCVPNYQLYLENEKKKKDADQKKEKREDTDKEKAKTKKEEPLMFREFVRQRFRPIAKTLTDCIRIMCTHLPSSFLSRENLKLMISVRDFLHTLESLLGMDNVVDKEMEELFMLSENVNNAISEFVSEPTGGAVNGSTAFLLCRTRIECLGILRFLRGVLKIPHSLEKGSIQELCLRGASLIFCTVSSSFRLHSVEMEPLEVLVIDEAAQLKECESSIPLQLLGIQQAILIGDERQLPAMVQSKVSEKAGFGRSLFERLSSLGHKKHLLNMQYRMQPSISYFPKANFYKNQILDAPNVKHESYRRHYLPGHMYSSYSFINVANGKEVLDNGHSIKNMVEVAVVFQLVRSLFEASLALKQKISVGVISPYAAQVSEIQKQLGKNFETHSDFIVSVKSIDGFQGGEEDVIIISTVRSNSKGAVGFLSNPQRTNVALTRARHCLWILGNGLTLTSSGLVWKKIVLDAKRRGCFFNADEDMHLAEAIIRAVIELDQINDLLHTDSLLFNRARWKVQFTLEFRNSFAQRKKPDIRKEVVEVVMKLSSGWHPKGDCNVMDGSSFQLLKQYNVKGQYLIWSVDILKDSNYIQVLKIWDIIPSAEIQKLIMRSNEVFEKYNKGHMLKCKFKCEEGELLVPMSWKICPDVDPPKNLGKTIDDLSSHFDSLNLREESSASTSQSRSKLFSTTSMATIGNNNLNAKLVLLGDMGAGKSSLVVRFVKGQFLESQELTIAADFFSHTLELNDVTVKFQIWDTAGQERYRSLAPVYYRGAAAAIIVYDITNTESFAHARKWVQELQEQGNPNMVMALAGNKADLEDKRKVTAKEARIYAEENGLFFMETSTKTAFNVNDIFYEIARRLPRTQLALNPTGIVVMDRPAKRTQPEQTKTSSCCYRF